MLKVKEIEEREMNEMKKLLSEADQVKTAKGSCLSEDLLARFLSGTLKKGELKSVNKHLSGCPTCRLEVMEIGKMAVGAK